MKICNLVLISTAAVTALAFAVANPPRAKAQCPAVNGQPAICHTLITVTDASVTVSFTGQPPYSAETDEVGDIDTLVGVINNSSEPVYTLWLTGNGSIFAFDGSGVATVGAGGNILDPTGYGGPNAFFMNINASKTAGRVVFLNRIPPAGGTSFFSLEGVLATACNCAQVINGSVTATATGTRIDATFKPNLGLNLQQAADCCDFVNFDWQQWITAWPAPSPLLQVGNTTPMTAPPAFLDPPPRGYSYQPGGDQSFPFYYDFKNSELLGKETAFQLSFHDAPADPCLFGGSGCSGDTAPAGSFMSFQTHLAGITTFGSAIPLDVGFTWKSDFNGTSGSSVRTKNDLAVDPGSGTGGVTITSRQTTTHYPGTTLTACRYWPWPSCSPSARGCWLIRSFSCYSGLPAGYSTEVTNCTATKSGKRSHRSPLQSMQAALLSEHRQSRDGKRLGIRRDIEECLSIDSHLRCRPAA